MRAVQSPTLASSSHWGMPGLYWGILGKSVVGTYHYSAHRTPNKSIEHYNNPTLACWLPGELAPTAGSAYLSGFDVNKDPEEIHRLVGFCPQFDALFETLTGREHLALYASIKVSSTAHMSWNELGVFGLDVGFVLCSRRGDIRLKRDTVLDLVGWSNEAGRQGRVTHRSPAYGTQAAPTELCVQTGELHLSPGPSLTTFCFFAVDLLRASRRKSGPLPWTGRSRRWGFCSMPTGRRAGTAAATSASCRWPWR